MPALRLPRADDLPAAEVFGPVRRDPRRFKAERRKYEQDIRHADILFEPGKCIDCGLCVQITAAGGEDLGLTYIGRGFDVRIGVPLGHSAAEALTKVAAECVAACPTAAIAWKKKTPNVRLLCDFTRSGIVRAVLLQYGEEAARFGSCCLLQSARAMI